MTALALSLLGVAVSIASLALTVRAHLAAQRRARRDD